mgnify:CR=1 FL=1
MDEDSDAYAAEDSNQISFNSKLYYDDAGQPVLLKRNVILTGENIVDASSGFDRNSRPSVNITLDGPGAKRFSNTTDDNIGKLMAVLFIESKSEQRIINGESKRVTRKYEKIISTFDITDCEEISISCINGLVKFSSNSDVSESEVILKQNKDIKDSEQSCVITNSVKLNQTTFCLKNLKGFLKGNILSDKVKIGLNIDYPIKILYSIGKDINSYLIYYLAPKIDDN